jgi:hypothetical protein
MVVVFAWCMVRFAITIVVMWHGFAVFSGCVVWLAVAIMVMWHGFAVFSGCVVRFAIAIVIMRNGGFFVLASNDDKSESSEYGC